MEGLLRGYYEREKATGKLGKQKSLRLPGGELAMRSTPLTWELDGDTGELLFLEWAKGHGLTHTKISPDWAAIKAKIIPMGKEEPEPIYQLTGEIMPGLRPKGREERFSVKTDEGDEAF